MKKVICYYITGFGFGHLTRSLAIIEQLLIRGDVRIIIKADDRLLAKAQQHLQKYEGRFSLCPFSSYFSIIFDQTTFCVDTKATGEDALRWIGTLANSARKETEFLREQRVALVLSDIVPEAFGAAAALGIPGIGISNFTWYEICVDVLGRDEQLRPLLNMYRLASEVLVYPFSTGALIPGVKKTGVGFVTRAFARAKIREIRDRYKKGTRPLAFLSVGGSTRVEDFPLREDMDYLVTMGIEVEDMPNVYHLPPDVLDSHNYLAACDVVITKCGWSTVAEAARAGVPMWLMLSKNGWLEERCIYREIASEGIGIGKTFEDMSTMTSAEVNRELDKLKRAFGNVSSRYYNGMAQIMVILRGYLK